MQQSALASDGNISLSEFICLFCDHMFFLWSICSFLEIHTFFLPICMFFSTIHIFFLQSICFFRWSIFFFWRLYVFWQFICFSFAFYVFFDKPVCLFPICLQSICLFLWSICFFQDLMLIWCNKFCSIVMAEQIGVAYIFFPRTPRATQVSWSCMKWQEDLFIAPQ